MVSVKPDDTLLTAYARMRAADVSQLPVLDGADLAGMLDEERLMLATFGRPDAFHPPVAEVMAAELESLDASASEQALLEVLTLGKVAVIRDGAAFLGFVTRIDLVNHMRRRMA